LHNVKLAVFQVYHGKNNLQQVYATTTKLI